MAHKPVLHADFLNQVELLLAPVEVLFLVGEIGLGEIVGGGVAAECGHHLVKRFDAFALDAEVFLDVGFGILNELALLFELHLRYAAEVEHAVGVLLHPFHLLSVMVDVLLSEFLKTLRFEELTLHFVDESALGKTVHNEL